MGKDTQEQGNGLPEIGLTLDDLIRRGARQVIHHVIEAELAQLLEQYEHVRRGRVTGRWYATGTCQNATCSPA